MVVDLADDDIDDALEVKLARIRAGLPLRVIDLFSGCGGMSLGLQRSQYTFLGGIENNPQAISTYARNIFKGTDQRTFELHSTPRDITTFTPEMFLREILQADRPDGLVDMIVGGPPCQAFSRIGRAKLCAVKQNPDAYRADERSNLYLHYLSYVRFFRPMVVLMENVPDIMNYGGVNVAEEIADTLESMGYRCRYTILNTAHYGVPQLRQRFYLIAILDALKINPSFPAPTHFIHVPSGYESAHAVALITLERKSFDAVRYVAPPQPAETLPVAVTVRDALADLPPIRGHLTGEMRRGVRKFDTLARYVQDVEPSSYAYEMRTWPGFESSEGVWDHVIRTLPRDYQIFKEMKPDDQYPQAYEIARRLFHDKLREYQEEHNVELSEDSDMYKDILKKTIPPYDPTKFPNKWWKLNPDQPSRTLTAHMGKDTYSHIHYDTDQARVISVREAARLQSFPDGFQFAGAMNAAFTQIGNAVAPLQSYALGKHIWQLLLTEVQRRHAVVSL